MSLRPISIFGFGVALCCPPEKDTRAGSPWDLLLRQGPNKDGVCVVSTGDDFNFFPLVLVHETVSYSDEYMPKSIPKDMVSEQDRWRFMIEVYIDEWGLRSDLAAGLSIPGFIHAPKMV
jgi:hypothetical protein